MASRRSSRSRPALGEDTGSPSTPAEAQEEGQARLREDGLQEGRERDLVRAEEGVLVERSAKVARSLDHGPQQVPVLLQGGSLREDVERGAHRV